MPKFNEDEVIDLTSYDYHAPRNNTSIVIYDEVIDLANDSFDLSANLISRNRRINKKDSSNKENRSSKSQGQDVAKTSDEQFMDKVTSNIGVCSICWEKLGNNPLASTKCGHVYCLACLEKSLKCKKQCPTCRCILKGSSAYHPLYLELG